MSRPMATSPALDPMVDLIDFSEYDNAYQSPSVSPTTTSKASFARPVTASTTSSSLLPTSQPLSRPSHQYDLYKQQTGIVPGALANTLAVNQNNSQITGYSDFNLNYLGMGTQDMFDFNTSPPQNTMNTSDMDLEFDSPSADPSFLFREATVNPNAIAGQEPQNLPSPVVQTQANNVGRLWPGMHQQAAMAKAQAQQRQQQQIIQQQQHRQNAQNQPKQSRAKSAQPSDPIVEQKITQLLNSMRAKSMSSDGSQASPMMHLPRTKKDEEDMDEDERLLASEEGKKLSSKERRQLRNKVSARAFRSRRKEYISQLEAEIANKVTENGDLRAQNRSLLDENKRLTDLTRMLLSSPSFSDFLDRLSANPQQLPQAQPAPQVEQRRQENRQAPKDVNVYAAQQQMEHQQIGVAMIPEQSLDFSVLNMGNDAFNFEPQVYAVLETPEVPVTPIDSSVLSGKTSNFVGEHFGAGDEKLEMPVIDRPLPEREKALAPQAPAPLNEEFESDPAFALYHDSPVSSTSVEPCELDTEPVSHIDLFAGIEPEKALSRYELVDADQEDAVATIAAARVQRITSNLDSLCARLEMLTADL